MKADDYTKVFWVLKYILDNDAHYVEPKRRVSLKNSLCAVLEIRDKKRNEEEAKDFRTCGDCCGQIDLRPTNPPQWKFTEDGRLVHARCPAKRDVYQNDL